MELIRGLHNLRPAHHGSVATIGNFDGVHLGHQAVIGQVRTEAQRFGEPMVVIAFEPQPREFFAGTHAPARLTRLREKLEALDRYGVDRILILRFDHRLAEMPAGEFIARILIAGLGVRHLVVGDDFRFGHGRQGDFAMLEQAGRANGFQVAAMATVLVGGVRVSSTRVRQALAYGELAMAARLLGRPYALSGRVAHGDKRGRTIGFPTANVFLHRRVTPVAGVFAVRVHGLAHTPVAGVANIGRRPTVAGQRVQLEVHLFDFEDDIYGRHIQVELCHKIREERKFASFAALRAQIHTDAAAARAYFAQPETNPQGRSQ
jgi:riboflavin kinase/FMN adenylyltransferase